MTPGKAGGEADGPAGGGGGGVGGGQDVADGRRRVGEESAFDGLHDDDEEVAFGGGFVAEAGLDAGIVPVGVVELELDELGFGVVVENAAEDIGGIVEGEADVADEAVVAEAVEIVPEAVAFVDFAV